MKFGGGREKGRGDKKGGEREKDKDRKNGWTTVI